MKTRHTYPGDVMKTGYTYPGDNDDAKALGWDTTISERVVLEVSVY